MSITAMFSYNMSSEGAKELSTALDVPRIRHFGSKFKAGSGKTILNWGASTDRFPAEYLKCRVLNHPNKIDRTVDKVGTFNRFQEMGVPIPDFTTSRATALSWLEGGSIVFARTQLRAHSGRGIVIMYPDLPDTWEQSAPLYTRYIKKKDEYRVHVMNGSVIDIQRKGLRSEFHGQSDINFLVRNLANGFVYTRNDDNNAPLLTSSSVPNVVKEVGIAAVQALELDFGAADIIYNQRHNQAYCLEVNTAPGITNTTVANYAAALSNY